jgi:flagellar FliJ protein
MKRYRSRLETVARVRAIEERSALALVARCQQERIAAEAAVGVARARFAEACTPAPSPAPVADVVVHRLVATWRGDGVREAGERLAAADRALHDARAAHHLARRRLRILERLDERRREEHRLELERLERVEADQLVADRWGRGEAG